MHEQIIRGTVPEVRGQLARPARGEITLVIEGQASAGAIEDVDLDALVMEWKREGLSTKEMTQRLRQDLGWKRNRAYKAILDASKPNQT